MKEEVEQTDDGWIHIPWDKRPAKIIIKDGKGFLLTKDWELDEDDGKWRSVGTAERK